MKNDLKVLALLSILCFSTFVAVAGLADGAAKRKGGKGRADFVEDVAMVIERIHESYFIEIENGQLLRWAVGAVYGRRGESVPEEIAEHIGRVSHFDHKELRAVLTQVAGDCKDDLRRCTDLAFDGILRHLDEGCDIWPARLPKFIGEPIYFPVGIGVRLNRDRATGRIRVLYPIRGGPAYNAGLRSGDVIEEIHRPEDALNKEETLGTREITLDRAYEALEGRPGTAVHLRISRPGAPRILEFDVLHDKAVEETVLGLGRDAKHDWNHWLDSAWKIAYLRVTKFNRDTSRDFGRVLGELRRQGMKGLVLDLRYNKGGLIDSAFHVAEFLIGKAHYCTIVRRSEMPYQYVGARGKVALGCPIVCLVNQDTADMPEVMAAALQDNKRAIIVGERTQGSAVRQPIFPVNHHYIRLTGSVFYRPSGKKLARISPPGKPSDEWGVTPDKGFALTLPPPERDRLRGHLEGLLAIPPAGRPAAEPDPAWTDRQMELALKYLRERIGKP